MTRLSVLLTAAMCVVSPGWTAETPFLVVDPGGHEAPVRALVFSNDGKSLYSAGDDKVVRVWNIEKGTIVRTIRGQVGDGDEGKVNTIALSPGNKRLAVAGYMTYSDGFYIRLHDLENSGEVSRVLGGAHDAITHVSFSPDGAKLASVSGDGVVRLYDLRQTSNLPSQEFKGHQGRVYYVSFSPDGKRLVSAGEDKSVILWDIASKKATVMPGHQNRVTSAIFCPTGKYIVSAAEDGRILLWDSKDGKFLKVLASLGGAAANLSFSADGKMLLAASNAVTGGVGNPIAQAYSVPDGRPLPDARFTTHSTTITATALAPVGHLAATAGGLRNEIYVWNAQTGHPHDGSPLVGHGRAVLKVAFANDGESIAFSNAIDGSRKKVFYLHKSGKYWPAFGGDLGQVGGAFTAELNRAKDVELRTAGPSNDPTQILEVIGAGRKTQAIARNDSNGYRHTAYTLTPDGQFVITGGVGGHLSLFRASDGKFMREFSGHTGDIMSVAASQDSRLFVSGAADQTLRVWDLNQETPLLNIFVADRNQWIAWIPSGYYSSNGDADQYIGWYTNRGPEKTALYDPAATYLNEFYKPKVVALYLERGNLKNALAGASEPTTSTPATVAQLRPPFVKLHWPPSRTNTQVPDETVVVKATAESITAPITEYQILVDGLIKVDEKKVSNRIGEPLEIVQQIQITPGRPNVIEVACYSGRLDKPGSESGTVTAPARLPPPKAGMYVLAVGLKDYQDSAMRLQFADADAKDFISVMETQKGGLFDGVYVYPRDADPARFRGATAKTVGLVNEKATLQNIKYGLAWLREAPESALKVVFLSGHGGIVNDEYYFFCWPFSKSDPAPDADNLDRTTLWKQLKEMKGPVLLIIDTCHSGAAGGEKGSREDNDRYMQYFKDAVPKGRTIFTYHSSGRDEKSKEDIAWKHGAFTYALLEALKEGKALKHHDTPLIFAKDLGEYLRCRVSELNPNQNADYVPTPSGASDFPIFYAKNAVTGAPAVTGSKCR